MAGTARAAPRRGRPPGNEALGRDEVVRAAADLVDREGWAALSLAHLARQLGRHATSMYAHVTSLEDLRNGISCLAAEELAERVWSAALGRVGADALTAIARQYRGYAVEHPGRTASLAAIDRSDPDFAERMVRVHQPLAAAFRSLGLTEEQCTSAHQIFGATINGLVNTGGAHELDNAVGLFVAALSTGTWPAPTDSEAPVSPPGRRRPARA